jgi:3-oxoacyl-[acyl-carrier protein] reductase
VAGRLIGKAALVTGASKGIGAEIARQLAAEGASVVVNYSTSKSGADRVVADIVNAGGKAIAVQGNVAVEADIRRVIAEAKAAYDKLDILVNNAGIYEFAPLDAITPEHFHKHFDLNVLGLLLTTREAVKLFPSKGGSVINISSGVATITPANTAVYSATKAAVDAITGSLSKELAPRGIRVNSVNPGMVATEGVKAAGLDEGDMRKWIEAVTPLARLGLTTEIAPAVVFLASNDSSYITGETLHITGGVH